MPEHWPFADPENLAVITLKRILANERAILLVTHDEDGDWQFLDGRTVSEADAAVVSLKRITLLDPGITELADLARGWRATRRSPDGLWIRSEKGQR
jgi:hypothetical protein